MKRARGLFEQIVSEGNLSGAIDEVNRTHRWRPGHRPNPCTAWVEETKPERVGELKRIILSGFEETPPKVKRRWDPSAGKWREISEPAQWPDQYVHHALIRVLQPVMMRGMDRLCCGSIRGRGPHYAKRHLSKWLSHDPKGTRWCLSCDIRHFYDTLEPSVVMERMRRLVKDRRALGLIWRVARGGIRIGAYTSQWFANTFLQPLDSLIRQSGLCSHYIRYMDNMTMLGANKRKLHKLRRLIAEWLEGHGLALKGDWQVFPVLSERCRGGRLVDAVGYRHGRGWSIPRKRTLLRIKRGIARARRRWGRGLEVPCRSAAGLLSRIGILTHCSNYSLYHMLYRGERVARRLKRVVSQARKGGLLAWSTYLEQREELRLSGRREGSTQALAAS